MDLTLSPEQDALREAAHGFIARAMPPGQLAATLDSQSPWRRDIYAKLSELGWLGISAPEDDGGSALGVLEEAIVLEEVGASLLPEPVLSGVGLALPLLVRAPEASDLLGELIAGTTVMTLAWVESEDATELSAAHDATLPAQLTAEGAWELTGTKHWVPDGERADSILVPALTDGGVAVFAVSSSSPGVAVTARDTFDPVRPLADVRLRAAPARLLIGPGEAAEALRQARLRTLVLASAEAVGIGRRMLDLTAAYASTREQFGRVIGTYQAVSHQIADRYVDLELSRSLLVWAALLLDGDDDLAPAAVSALGSKALPMAVRACETAIQLHGGIGTTWESPLHRYLKHALALSTIDQAASGLRAQALAAALTTPVPV